jgi:hypothetical protein
VVAASTPKNRRLEVLAAALASAAMIAQQVAGKATRDALFLTQYDVGRLPGMMIVSAILSFGSAIVAARALARFGPGPVVRVAFVLNALAFAAEFAISHISRRTLPIAVYLHLALFGATLISLFWSLVNERFDPHTAKSAMARIAAGGTAGGLIGGLIGWRTATVASVATMLAVLAALNALALVALSGLRRTKLSSEARPSTGSTAPARRHVAAGIGPTDDASARGRPVAVRSDRYLAMLGAMVAIVAATEAIVDIAFAARVTAAVGSGPPLMAFFSVFHLVVGASAFAAQTLLSRRALDGLGLAGTIVILPLGVVLLGATALGAPGLVTVVLLRGGEAVVSNSLWRSAYELLYTPVAPARKRATKALIDVGCDRLGTGLGAILVAGVLAVSKAGEGVLLACATILGLLGIAVARALHRGYVASLEESLRSGAIRLEEREIVDATTRRTLTASTTWAAGDRGSEGIGGRASRSRALSSIARARSAGIEADAPTATRDDDPIVLAIADLRSGDRLRAQRALCAGPDDPVLAPFVVPLLGRDETRGEAAAWLRRLSPRIVGILVDALSDHALDPAIRRRIPRALRIAGGQRAASGLVDGLADPRFEVRYECGAALARLVDKDPTLAVPPAKVLDAVRRELACERALLRDARISEPPAGDRVTSPSQLARIDWTAAQDRSGRVDRGIEHVFTILSLLLEREPLRMAFRALHAGDDRLRGTALEYLDNVLPTEVRDALWPYIAGAHRVIGRGRPRHEIVAALRAGERARPSAG